MHFFAIATYLICVMAKFPPLQFPLLHFRLDLHQHLPTDEVDQITH